MEPTGIVCEPTCAGAVLEAVVHASAATAAFPTLHTRLQSHAASRLCIAEAGSDAAALERMIELATAVQVDGTAIARARAALDDMSDAAERHARRESLGIGSLPLPDEFICSITMDKMRGVLVHTCELTRVAPLPCSTSHPSIHHPTSAGCAWDEHTRTYSVWCRPGDGVRLPLVRALHIHVHVHIHIHIPIQTRWWRAMDTRTSAPPSWT